MTEKKFGGRIENWKHTEFWNGAMVVIGNVYNDPNERWVEGYYIHTSEVIKIDYDNMEVETLNSVYSLGTQLEGNW